MSERTDNDRRGRARRALRIAAGGAEPDISRLVAGMPEIMARARRRRSREPQVDPLSAVVLLSRRVIPAMAVTAAALVLVALLAGRHETSGTPDPATGVESFLLTGKAGDDISDVLLEAMTARGNDDG